ncbi:putative transcription factor C3H family [Rosa chinensis]|uniref:Putative transcription factor C3H family n=1 Tax=Rosa chinensis TaxID=74649 RepID=A0A2P6P5A6_ROSCH|nr:putative transcription factor C3H family [Rosa chinensis]
MVLMSLIHLMIITQTAVSLSFTLSDKGLPLRPDQNICTHYSRYGIRKFGPACKFDHPSHLTSSTTSDLDHQLPFSDLANTKEAGIARCRSGTDDIIQLQQAV